MGVFAFYNGWVYNEFFAIPMEIFGSCYEEEPKQLEDPKDGMIIYGFKRTKIEGGDYCVYNFGIDPRWF